MIDQALIFVIDPLLFGLAFILLRGNTYGILCFAAVVNMLIYPFTDEYTVVIRCFVDAVILSSLVAFGDKHYWYQIGLLMMAMVCHIYFELDQVTGTDVILSNYDTTIIGITILQLLGAGYGIALSVFKRVWKSDKRDCFPAYSRNPAMVKVWQKKQQGY